jgi:small subunit ribosomal protein S18
MPRKTNLDRPRGGRSSRSRGAGPSEVRIPRPKPKIDFTLDALDYRNTNLLRQFVTDAGRLLPRKYTGLPAHYQRQLTRSLKRARQALLMK